MARTIQPAFSRGEIAPDLFGRVDTTAYQLGLATARNVFIHTYGGVSNRPGTIFVGPTKDHTKRARLIPFQFKQTDTHILEFGDLYIRIIRNDAHVGEAPFTVTAATQADPVAITTSAPHGYTTGDDVFLANIGGMIEISGTIFRITVTGATTFTLQSQVTGVDVDGTGFTAFTSGGTASKIFTLVTPYLESELRDIKYSQTADIMTLAHPNHDPRELRRLAVDDWTLTEITFAPTQQPPTVVTVTVRGTPGSVKAKYKVTATSALGEESLPGLGATASLAISAITNANPAQVTTSLVHGLDDGDEIEITQVTGMTEVNDRRYRVTIVDTTNVTLRDVDSTNFATYISTGIIRQAFHFVPNSNDDFENDIAWTAVANASFYSVFREQNGLFGFIGETEDVMFEDDSTKITVNLSETPPTERNPFFGTGNFPGAVGSHQQRRVFGGSDNRPDTTFYSKIGTPNNFTVAVPSRDNDSITAVLPAAEVNQIRHYVSLNELLLFNSGSEWLVRGSSDIGFTASTINQRFQSNWGTAQLRPIVVGATVLFAVDPGISVRTFGFNIQIDGFQSSVLSILVPHLFRNFQILEWDYSRKPESLVYMIRDDGDLLVLSFEEEQQVIGWAHWDTDGTYESVAVIRPSIDDLTDAGYFVTKRLINGSTVRLIERTHAREFEDVQDAFFVDSGLTLDNPVAIEDIDEADPVKITITAHPFVDGDEVDISDIIWVPDVDSKFNATQPDQLNGGRFEVANATANDFTLKSIDTGDDIDGSAFNPYVEGGNVRLTVKTIFGFQHLANTPVVILADGNVVRGVTVSATGSVTLPRKFSRIHVGLPFVSDVETLDLEIRGPQTIQGVLKKLPKVTIRFSRSRGLLFGPDTNDLTEMKQREFEKLGEPTKLLTGTKEVIMAPSWNEPGRIFMRQKDPLPMTILAVVPEFEVGDVD